MNDDELKNLLRGAEADFERPTVAPGDLAERVRGLDRRRRQRMRILVAAAPLSVVGAIIAAWSLWPGAAAMKMDERVASVPFDENEIERLRAEAEFHERVARQMIAHSRQARMSGAERDPRAGIDELVDIVAYRMVLRADDFRTDMEPPDEAIRVYRDVVRLFPQTHSADVARKRLTALGARQRGT